MACLLPRMEWGGRAKSASGAQQGIRVVGSENDRQENQAGSQEASEKKLELIAKKRALQGPDPGESGDAQGDVLILSASQAGGWYALASGFLFSRVPFQKPQSVAGRHRYCSPPTSRFASSSLLRPRSQNEVGALPRDKAQGFLTFG